MTPALRAALLLAALPLPLAAQDAVNATYTIQREGREAGRERLVLRPGQGRGLAGSTVLIEGRRTDTGEELRASVARMEDGTEDNVALEVRRKAGVSTVRAANRAGRIFITSVGDGARGGRELPGGPGVVFLDDDLALLAVGAADLATASGTRLTGVFVRTGRRVAFTARRTDTPAGSQVELSGELTGRLVLDRSGRPERLELASLGLVATRLPD